MQSDKIIVTISGLTGIVLTYWFFLTKKDKPVLAEKVVDIKVEGGYSPEVISIPVGKPTQINFVRTDSNNCLEEVVLPDFKIKKYLPLNKKISITIVPSKTGNYDITCGMNMFHGKLIVT
jgi:plastocyanin domain-containing protein